MGNDITEIVDILYRGFVTGPDRSLWPSYIEDPVLGHGLWSFYQGLRLGMQLSLACLETR